MISNGIYFPLALTISFSVYISIHLEQMVRLCIEKWHVLENIWTQDHGRMVFIVLLALLSLSCYMAAISWAKRDLQSSKHISRPTRTPWISAEPECLSFISYFVCMFMKYVFNLTSTDADSLSFVIWMSSLAIKLAVSLYVVIALSSLFTSFFTIKSSSQLLYLFKHPFYVTLITCSLFFCSFIPLVVRLGLSFSPCHTSMHLTAILLGY